VFAASRSGDVKALKTILDSGRDAVRERDHLERTALHLAAYTGSLACVKLLLSKGADPNAPAKDHMLPSHFAAMKGHSDCVVACIDGGAPVSAQGGKRHWTALMFAANSGQKDTCKALLGKGATKSTGDRDGKTASDLADESGHKEVSVMLLSHKERVERGLIGPSDGDRAGKRDRDEVVAASSEAKRTKE
jgi:uncharacterized protein